MIMHITTNNKGILFQNYQSSIYISLIKANHNKDEIYLSYKRSVIQIAEHQVMIYEEGAEISLRNIKCYGRKK